MRSGLTALRSTLMVASLLAAAACGDSKGGSGAPDLPQVTITVPEPQLMALSVPVVVTISGCERAVQLDVYDRGALVRTIYDPGVRTTMEIPPEDINFDEGLAATLSLTGKVVCSDGRVNTSQPASARFLPVAQVVEPVDEGSVVTDTFIADGKGADVAFIGCAGTGEGGVQLVKVNVRGEVVAKNDQLPFPCTSGSVITERNSLSKMRWLWDPNVGAFSFNDALEIVGVSDLKVDLFVPAPDGDGIVYDTGEGGTQMKVYRIGHLTGDIVVTWIPQGFLTGSPAFIPGTTKAGPLLVVPSFSTDSTTTSGTMAVEAFDYNSSNRVSYTNLKDVSFGFLDSPYTPATSFSADGLTTFLAYPAADGKSYVEACVTFPQAPEPKDNCDRAGNRRWKSPVLQGLASLSLSYANGTRLAAIAPQHVTFLDTETGKVVNKDAAPLSPSGQMKVLSVDGAMGGEFYMLNGGPPAGSSNPLAREILVTDKAENGQLYRFELAGGSISMALDDTNTAWFRVGRRLVRPLPLQSYRDLLP